MHPAFPLHELTTWLQTPNLAASQCDRGARGPFCASTALRPMMQVTNFTSPGGCAARATPIAGDVPPMSRLPRQRSARGSSRFAGSVLLPRQRAIAPPDGDARLIPQHQLVRMGNQPGYSQPHPGQVASARPTRPSGRESGQCQLRRPHLVSWRLLMHRVCRSKVGSPWWRQLGVNQIYQRMCGTCGTRHPVYCIT
jgi:hypothetical protein